MPDCLLPPKAVRRSRRNQLLTQTTPASTCPATQRARAVVGSDSRRQTVGQAVGQLDRFFLGIERADVATRTENLLCDQRRIVRQVSPDGRLHPRPTTAAIEPSFSVSDLAVATHSKSLTDTLRKKANIVPSG